MVGGIGLLLKQEGVAVIEAPYVKDLIDHCEFDTIYHEHLCYFSLTALVNLFRQHGMSIVDVERLPIHGGSLRIFASKTGNVSERVKNLLQEEKTWGVDQFDFYAKFAEKVEHLRATLRTELESFEAAE